MESEELPKEYVERLGRRGFNLQKVLGRGGSGSVYLALQPSLNRKVAVKFFDSAFARESHTTHKRFMREARILAKFQHSGFPYVLTEGSVETFFGKAPYFVMEYVEGKSLREILNQSGKLPLEVSTDYICQVLRALAYAHTRQILHRDLKPANIMVGENGRCFVIDFSIGVSTVGEAGLTRATKIGDQIGTPQYMSPEQLNDPANVDNRTDIYSIGVVFLELLSGSTDRTNIAKTLVDVPPSIVDAIDKACKANPSVRYADAEEFIRALEIGLKIRGPSSSPALAICTNKKCSGADWTSRGFYRGPRIAEQCLDPFCTFCGEKLTYQCGECGHSIATTPHCGNCGTKNFQVPECARCGSWLTRGDMVGTLGEGGCSKCKGKAPKNAIAKFDDIDDDIPF